MHKIPGAQFQAPVLHLRAFIGCRYQDGNLFPVIMCGILFQKSVSVHHRHDQIQYDPFHIFPFSAKYVQRLPPVSRFQDTVFGMQDLFEDLPVQFAVVHNQNCFIHMYSLRRLL